ncbi:MAG TPA: hypothetical protein VD884_09695 [Ohtaekwangia sp.]|nr:hypothetical protein [Ohtaekwangia sp.]
MTNKDQALIVEKTIHEILPDCSVNFDLEDCDRILRMMRDGYIDPSPIIALLNDLGFKAEVLSDDQPVNPLLEITLQE